MGMERTVARYRRPTERAKQQCCASALLDALLCPDQVAPELAATDDDVEPFRRFPWQPERPSAIRLKSTAMIIRLISSPPARVSANDSDVTIDL
jgi:hypothetical protein